MTPGQRLIHAVPIAVSPISRLKFQRMHVVPGVLIRSYSGRMVKEIERRVKALPEQLKFTPSHLLFVDQTAYLNALDLRLNAENKIRERHEHELLDIHGITRQILMAMMLIGRVTWQVAGIHCFDYSDAALPYRANSYVPSPTEPVSDLFRWSVPKGWFTDVSSSALRTTCGHLDRYYRCGVWWVDRLSVALGYLWSALTTTHSELSFAALCMALEAIATTSQTEVTHTLSERCALLARTNLHERLNVYAEIKSLYKLRSQIVHGNSAPIKGHITLERLAITAKQSIVPRTKMFSMLSITIEVIKGVLRSHDLLEILHARQNEDKTSKAIDEYFQRQLLR